jgi:hypothetical protein
MGNSLFRPAFSWFFPGQVSGWFTQFRWGFGRISGPYGHAIMMGCILSIGYLFWRWLARYGQWEPNFRIVGALPLSKSRILVLGLLGGMIMTLSRGPWLAATCALIIASIGSVANRRRALKQATILLVGGGLLIYVGGKAYVDKARPAVAMGSSSYAPEEEQSAAYRAVLIDQYIDIAMQRPFWGWGRANWPAVPGMSSIDNNILFLALSSGLVGVFLFVAMIAVASWRLFMAGFFRDDLASSERAFLFTLLGMFTSIAVSSVTVYLGSQLLPLLFLFMGWSDACLLALPKEEAYATESEIAGYELMRVVA